MVTLCCSPVTRVGYIVWDSNHVVLDMVDAMRMVAIDTTISQLGLRLRYRI